MINKNSEVKISPIIFAIIKFISIISKKKNNDPLDKKGLIRLKEKYNLKKFFSSLKTNNRIKLADNTAINNLIKKLITSGPKNLINCNKLKIYNSKM